MSIWRHYLAALGFLTRLGPAVRDPDMAACVPCFPLVGATLGLVLAVPLAFGLFGGYPLAGAFAYAVGNLALTRGLHLDGFADVADAWGSFTRGERFFAIMKDSRIGAFGGMAIAVALVGQTALGAEILGAGKLWLLAAAPVFGRALAVALMRCCRDLGRPGLGSLCLPGATRSATAFSVVFGLAALAAAGGIRAGVCGAALGGVVLWRLAALAREQGGINGDFLGAAIVAGELCALAGGLL